MNDEPIEPHSHEPRDHDPELEMKVQAVLANRQRDRTDARYNVLNAATWHGYAGHLANRIVDLEAYFGPLSDLLDSLREAAREADNAAELIAVLEKIEAYNLDARRFVGELRKLSDAMDAELAWCFDEIHREWGRMEPEQGDEGN